MPDTRAKMLADLPTETKALWRKAWRGNAKAAAAIHCERCYYSPPAQCQQELCEFYGCRPGPTREPAQIELLRTQWSILWKAKHRKDYPWATKHAIAAKVILDKAGSWEDAVKICKRYLADADDFVVGHPLSLLLTRLERYMVATAEEIQQEQREAARRASL